MSFVAVAIGGSAALGALASDRASKRQAGAAGDAAGMTMEQYVQNRRDLAPYRKTGELANSRLQTLLGLRGAEGTPDWDAYLKLYPEVAQDYYYYNRPEEHFERWGKGYGYKVPTISGPSTDPEFGSLLDPFTGKDLENEPGYQFGLTEGSKAIDRAASAAGRFNSGATLKALTRFGNDYASTKYNDAYSRDAADKSRVYGMLSGQTSQGANVAGMTAGLGANAAGTAGNALMQGADASAAGLVGGANALSSGVGSYLGYLNNQSTLDYLKGLRQGNLSTGGGWTAPNTWGVTK